MIGGMKRGVRAVDVVEPIVGLPFAFGVILLFEQGWTLFASLTLIGLFFVYLPVLIVCFDRRVL